MNYQMLFRRQTTLRRTLRVRDVLRHIVHVFLLIALASCAVQAPPPVNVFNQLDLARSELTQDSALMLAAESGNATGVKNALMQGDLINGHNPRGSAFSLAIKNKHYGLSKFLLAAGADPTIGLEAGSESALMLASKEAVNDLLTELIIRNADMDYVDDFGRSAVSEAALNGHLTTLKILIEAGANVNSVPFGMSVLMHVVKNNNMLISQLLIAAGADVNFRDDDGDSALRIARRMGYVDLDLMLMQAGARP